MTDASHRSPATRGPADSIRGILRTTIILFNPLRLRHSIKNLGLWFQVIKNPEALEVWRRYFDPVYYIRTHADVANKGVEPCIHFLLRGNAEGRQPSDLFDLQAYLRQYPDVAGMGINGLLHYALFGRAEGRSAPGLVDSHETGPDSARNESLRCQPALVTNAALAPAPQPSNQPEQVVEADKKSASSPLLVVNNYWRSDLPLLSVVIPCFNYGQYVEEAVRSVLAQTFSVAEILVIDGGSTDADSLQHLKRLEAARPPGVTVYYREGRHLVGDNRNFGISRAQGRYICCLDADDRLRPTYLEVALFLAEGYGFDLVCSSVQCFGGSDEQWLVTDPTFLEISERNRIPTTAVFRKSAWAHAGGFRDWVPGHEYVPEDWEFWVRLLGYGCRVKSIREPLYEYRVHRKGITSASDMDPARQRNAIRQANSGLFDMVNSARTPSVTVLNPWVNIDEPSDDPRPGFLLALPFVSIGGAETLLYDLAGGIAAKGFRLIVVTSLPVPEGLPDKLMRFTALTPHVYPLASLFHDAGLPEDFICRLIHRHRVSHLLFAGCELLYTLLPRLDKEFPDLVVIDQLFNDRAFAPNNRRYRQYIDATVVPSQALQSSIHDRTPDDPGAIHVIPHAVSIPDLPPEPTEELRARLSLPTDKIIVAFFGRLSEEKGGEIFVEIARELANDDRLFFLMTGDGPERERILRKIAQYRLDSRMYIAGFVEDLAPFMRAADIVVVPSLLDGMPLVVLEAQAYGKPVVASAVGSIPGMIVDGETGYLCSPGHVAAFSLRIAELAANPRLSQSIGQAGRIAVRRNHRSESMVDAYFRIFERAKPKSDAAYGATAADLSSQDRSEEKAAVLPINNDWRRDLPLISVVIPVFNNAEYLEDGIRSILNQTFQDLEVIVVEGGSTNADTVQKVRELEDLGLPKTRFFYRPERHHVGDNKNFGTAMARGRYICCLDQDDMLGQVYLEVAVFLAEVFGYELVYPSLRAFGKPGARWAYGDANLRWLVVDPSFPEILNENLVPNSALFTRSAWAHVGGYRDFGTFAEYVQEDWDFWIRLVGHGFRGISIRELLHLYRVLETGMTASYKPDLDRQRERLRLANASLAETFRKAEKIHRAVLNPYANLGPVDENRTAVLFGLPALADEASLERFRAQGESFVARGERLLVVTSLTSAEANGEDAWQVPDPDRCFDGITSHVYRLSWLFHNEEHCHEFLRYLIRRYRVHTVLPAGCDSLQRRLPDLQREFADLAVVDAFRLTDQDQSFSTANSAH